MFYYYDTDEEYISGSWSKASDDPKWKEYSLHNRVSTEIQGVSNDNNVDVSIILTDMENRLKILEDNIVSVNAKVLSLENGIMFIEYKDGTKKDINLNEVPFKHTNAGKYHMNNKIARFKVGDKFEKGDIIAYDPKQFNHDIFGDVCDKH